MDHSMLIMGNVLDNDTDVDSAHSDLTVTTASVDPIVGAYGSLTMNADGSYSYQIDDSNTAVLALQTGQSVQEVFNYTMSDNHPTDPKSSSSTLTITINGTNDAPVAVADVQSVDEGNETTASPILVGNLLTNDTDVDSPAADFTVTSPTADPIVGLYGTLTLNTNGDYSYVLDNANPDVDALNVGASLQDVFNYTMSDNDAVDPKSASSTLTITINGTNDAPVAVADTNAGDVGNEVVPSALVVGNVLDNDTDVDNAQADFTVTTASVDPIVGLYGSLTLNADGSYSYQIDDANPVASALNVGESVQDVFNYTISDNNPTDPKTSSSTLTITLNGTNDAPIAVADVNSGNEGNETTPSVVLVGNVLSNDTDADSLPGDFTVTTASPDPIVGLYGSLMLNVDGSYSYTIDDANASVDALNVGDSVQDVFNYTMSDNNPTNPKFASSTLTITINGTNDAPVAQADAMAGDKGLEAVPSVPIVGNVLDNDTDVDGVQADFTVTSASVDPIVGTYGSLTLNADGSYSYVIDDANIAVDALRVGESLQDVFNYTMSDNNPTDPKTSNSMLTITINGVNNPPVAVADTNAGNEGNETIPSEPVVGNVLSNDTDIDNLPSAFTVTTASVDPIVGSYGSLMLNADGSYSYVIDDANPTIDALNVGQSVQDVFNYTMSDNDAIDPKTASSTLTITINGTNDKPVAVASLNAGNEGNETVPSVPVVGNVLDNVTDVDNARADWTITSPTTDPLVGAYGTLTLNLDGSYSYVIDDENIAVNALNTGGSVIDIFNYTMSDNNPTNPKSVSSTLTIRIDGTNDAPTANADTKFRNQGSDGYSSVPIFGNVLDNDRDPDSPNGDFTVTSASGGDIAGAYGILSLNPDGTYTYVINDANSAVQALNVGDVLNDAFNYTMSDNHPTDPKFSSSILTIVIVGTNSAPLAVADVNDITEGNETVPSVPVVGNVLDNDTDIDSAQGSFIVTTASNDPIVGAYGSLLLHEDGSYTYTLDDANATVDALNVGQLLEDVFNYTMSDNNATDPKTSSSTLTIRIHGTNDAPVAVADTNAGDEGNETVPSVPVVGNVLDNDTDVDSAQSAFTVTSDTVDPMVGSYGTLTMSANGDYSYVIDDANPTVDALNVGDSLVDTFDYTMSDNHPTDPKSASSTLAITINGTNDAPLSLADVNSGNQGPVMFMLRSSVKDKIKVNDVLADSMSEQNVIDFPQEVLSAPPVASLESMGLHTLMNHYVDVI